jgi:prevent-host-death family protein
MKCDTDDLIAISDVKSQLSQLVKDADAGRDIFVLVNNRPTAALVGIGRLERLNALEDEMEGLRVFTVAALRQSQATDAETINFDAVLDKLGVDPDALFAAVARPADETDSASSQVDIVTGSFPSDYTESTSAVVS